jgi:hypothetical protein
MAALTEPLTTLDELQRKVHLLALIDETEAPLVTCYMGLEQGISAARYAFAKQCAAIRPAIERGAVIDFDAAIQEIAAYLATRLRTDARGVAVFARSVLGGHFFLPMQFAVPVADRVTASPVPDLLQLMSIRDRYERYAVLVATLEHCCLFEVSLGVATLYRCSARPRESDAPIPSRAGATNPYRSRARFLRSQVRQLLRFTIAAGHAHLMLVGDPRATAAIGRMLPAFLSARLVDTIPVRPGWSLEEVVEATVSAFATWEENRSQVAAARLVLEVERHGAAAVGWSACLDALRRREAQLLVLARGHVPAAAWRCAACGTMRLRPLAPATCPECGRKTVWTVDATSELMRLAGQRNCPVELVEHCDSLMAMGGVGCVLRR